MVFYLQKKFLFLGHQRYKTGLSRSIHLIVNQQNGGNAASAVKSSQALLATFAYSSADTSTNWYASQNLLYDFMK